MAAVAPPARLQLTPFPRVPKVTWRGLHHPVHSFQTKRAVASLANSASTDAVTVVITGDSTSLDTGNDSLTVFDTMYGLIVRKLTLENPGITFRFINRGIGGSTWAHLATTAVANFPAWYTAQAQPWINTYISPLGNGGTNKAPDLVIIIMGTNDNSTAGFVSPAAVLANFANTTQFPTTPDIWFCTSFGRTTDLSLSTTAQNAGAILASNLNRTIARCGHAKLATTGIYPRPLGLLDFGRMWTQTTLGVDYGAQSLVQYTTAQLAPYQGMTALGTTGFALPQCDGDFDMTLTFPAQGSTLLAGRAARLDIGATMGGSAVSKFLLQISGTTVSTSFQPGLGAVSFNGTSATVAAGSDVVIRCTAKQEHVFLSINGTTVMDAVVARAVSPFTPRWYYAVDGANDLVLNLTTFRAGKAVPYASTLNNLTAWGENAVGINGATGGNKINHPSSLYIQEVVAPVLGAENFCFS